MTAPGPGRASGWALLGYPGLMLLVFFLMPFGIMLAVSFFHAAGAGFTPAFTLDNYARLGAPVFLRVLLFSVYIGALVAAVSIAVSFPFTYLLSRLSVRAQTAWLVFLLSILSLSEVIVGFSWSVLLSRTAGVSNLFVQLGWMAAPRAYTPGFMAEVLAFCYLTFPYTVLMLYPQLSRLNPELTEAARTMGASPLRAFFTVVVPAMRQPVIGALVLAFVFTLGVYLIPQILGRPAQWTLSVLITDQAVARSNMPFAAALAMLLLLTSMALIAITLLLGRERSAARWPKAA